MKSVVRDVSKDWPFVVRGSSEAACFLFTVRKEEGTTLFLEGILFPYFFVSDLTDTFVVVDCSGTSLCGDFENVDAQVTDQVTGADDGSGQCTWGTDATYMTVANIVFLVCGILLCLYVPSHKNESSSLSLSSSLLSLFQYNLHFFLFSAPQPEPICKQ